VIESVGQHSGGIAKILLPEDHCIHCKTVAERQDHPADLEHLAATRTVGCCNNCYKHYAAVVDPRYNIGRIRWVQKRKPRTVAVAATGAVGFDSLRTDFETKELAD
jgi:hypothetical protein